MSDLGGRSGSAARGAKATLLGQWMKFCVQFASTIVLARILSPADFGQFAMIVAFSGLATLIGDMGLSTASIQAKTISHRQQSNLFWLNVGVGGLCAALAFVLAPAIADFYGQPALVENMRTLAPVFIVQAALAQFAASATRLRKFKLLAVIDVSGQMAAFGAALFFALAGVGVLALIVQQLVLASWALMVLLIAGSWKPGLPGRAPMRPLLGFGVNSFLVQLLTYISSNVDSVLLGRMWGPAPLGIYDRAYQLFRMPIQQIATPLTRVVLPILSPRQDDLRWVSEKLTEIQRIMAYGVGGAFAVGAACAPALIGILLGEKWGAAAPVFAVLAVGGLFQAIGYAYYWAFLVTNKTGIQLRFSFVTRSLMVLFIATGVIWGPIGVAVGVACGLFANWAVLSLWPMKSTGLDVRQLVIAAVRPASVHMLANLPSFWLGLTLADHDSDWLVLLLQGGLSLACYGAAVLMSRSVRSDAVSIYCTLKKAL